jgi:hypothetical protein
MFGYVLSGGLENPAIVLVYRRKLIGLFFNNGTWFQPQIDWIICTSTLICSKDQQQNQNNSSHE